MFGLEFVLLAQVQQQIDLHAEEDARARLSPVEFSAWLKDRDERREKARQEAIAERRHRELCSAIRSTSFWRL
jgi:hypothetical protein